MKKLFFFPLLFLSLACLSQKDDASKYASTISVEYLQKHLTVLASDEMEGRETGTAGERRAADYIEAEFKRNGLISPANLKGYRQFFPLHKDSLDEAELEINGKSVKYGMDYISPAGTNETGKFKGKSVIFAGYGIEDSS